MLPPNYTYLTIEQAIKASQTTNYWELYIFNNVTQKGRSKRTWMLDWMLIGIREGNLKIAIHNDQLGTLAF
jgi:hypothetical protein